MADAILLLALLLAIVLVACLMVWDTTNGFRWLARRERVEAERYDRRIEDVYWLFRAFEYRTAVEITLARLNVRHIDDLVERLEGAA